VTSPINYAGDGDTRLMIEFCGGDDSAFDRLVKRFQRQVFATAYRYTGNGDQAEDCAQEVFIRLYKMRGKYRATARISTLIYRITANLCLNYVRDRKRRRMLSLDRPAGETEEPVGALVEDGAAEDVSARMEKAERAEIVRRALDQIPDRQRIALILHRFEGLSYADIAETMEINVAAVKSLLSRARASLAEALRGDIEAGNL
jgi:RNA polymerase sigma-70 factor (ECF subfamily)